MPSSGPGAKTTGAWNSNLATNTSAAVPLTNIAAERRSARTRPSNAPDPTTAMTAADMKYGSYQTASCPKNQSNAIAKTAERIVPKTSHQPLAPSTEILVLADHTITTSNMRPPTIASGSCASGGIGILIRTDIRYRSPLGESAKPSIICKQPGSSRTTYWLNSAPYFFSASLASTTPPNFLMERSRSFLRSPTVR